MATMRDMGCAVGEYVGDGQGESETQESTPTDLIYNDHITDIYKVELLSH